MDIMQTIPSSTLHPSKYTHDNIAPIKTTKADNGRFTDSRCNFEAYISNVVTKNQQSFD